MKIQAYKNPELEVIPCDKSNMDIFVTRYKEVTTYEAGKRITERQQERVNISKKVKETAKVVKVDQSQEILNQVKAILG